VTWSSAKTATAAAWRSRNAVPAPVGDHQPATTATTLAATHSRLPATTTRTAGWLGRGRDPRSHNPAA
jgi:hypothetical protein